MKFFIVLIEMVQEWIVECDRRTGCPLKINLTFLSKNLGIFLIFELCWTEISYLLET